MQYPHAWFTNPTALRIHSVHHRFNHPIPFFLPDMHDDCMGRKGRGLQELGSQGNSLSGSRRMKSTWTDLDRGWPLTVSTACSQEAWGRCCPRTWCPPWRHTCQDGHASKHSNSMTIPQVLLSSQSTSFSSLARFFSSETSILAGTWQAFRKHCDLLCAGISAQKRQSTLQILLPLHPSFIQQEALGCSSSYLTSWPSAETQSR